MSQFVKFGLTTEALRSYVSLIAAETSAYIRNSKYFSGESGTLNVPKAMAELTIYTASRSLQGKEVREKFDSTFADLYHDLDMGFTPINFMLPWAPLPQNRKRDFAQRKMAQTYLDIIKARREDEEQGVPRSDDTDMIWNLMSCKYKDGQPLPDKEIAHMMIALLMAGQHSSSASISWILLRLASQPDIVEELLQEQKTVLGDTSAELTFEDLSRLPLHAQVVKETLRLHSPIHSIMRAVKSPMPVEGTPYVIPPTHTLMAAPGVTSKMADFFPEPALWEPHRWDAEEKATGSDEKYDKLKPVMVAQDEEEKTDYGYGLVSKGAGSPYLPFGAGRHRCIGEQFAYLQLQTIMATMIRSLRFRNTDGVEGVVGTDYSVSTCEVPIYVSVPLLMFSSHCSHAHFHRLSSCSRRGQEFLRRAVEVDGSVRTIGAFLFRCRIALHRRYGRNEVDWLESLTTRESPPNTPSIDNFFGANVIRRRLFLSNP